MGATPVSHRQVPGYQPTERGREYCFSSSRSERLNGLVRSLVRGYVLDSASGHTDSLHITVVSWARQSAFQSQRIQGIRSGNKRIR